MKTLDKYQERLVSEFSKEEDMKEIEEFLINENKSFNYRVERQLSFLTNEIRSYAEHAMIGSTTYSLKSPWKPYALASGKMDLELVNAQRKSQTFMTNLGSVMNLPDATEVFMHYGEVDEKTLEADYPTVFKAFGYIDDEFQELDISEAKYVGPFQKVKTNKAVNNLHRIL